MTILLTLWRILTGNPIARAVGAAFAGLVALWAYGVTKKREGAVAARSDAAAKAAKAKEKTIEEVLRETPSDDTADAIRDRMRKRAKR